MIIEYKKNISCDFTDLWAGDVFAIYADGEKYIYMKTNGAIYNAVNLSTNDVEEIEPHQKVEKINAKIIIE